MSDRVVSDIIKYHFENAFITPLYAIAYNIVNSMENLRFGNTSSSRSRGLWFVTVYDLNIFCLKCTQNLGNSVSIG